MIPYLASQRNMTVKIMPNWTIGVQTDRIEIGNARVNNIIIKFYRYFKCSTVPVFQTFDKYDAVSFIYGF